MSTRGLPQFLTMVGLICVFFSDRAFAQITEAQLKKAKANCAGENLEDSSARIQVDANTGRTQGTVRFPARTKVQVVVVGKNPFKYSYRTDISAAPLEETIAKAFFETVVQGMKPVAVPVAPAAPPGGGVPAAFVNGCNDADVKRVESESTAVKEAQTALDALLDARVNAFAAYTAFFDVSDGVFPDSAACSKVVDSAATLHPQLGLLTDAAFIKAAERFVNTVAVLDAGLSALPDACAKTDWAAALKKSLEGLKKKSEQVNSIIKAKPLVDALRKRIDWVFASDYPFQQAYYPPIVGQATGVVIKTYRTNLRLPDAKEEQVASVDVQIGESVVSVSMGFGASNAADIAIGRRPAYVPAPTPPAAEPTTLGNRLGYIANSEGQRPVILTMLNARLPEVIATSPKARFWSRVVPAALSTGIAFRIDGSTKGQTEWIPVAVGWNLGSDHVLFTMGLHLSRIDTLDQKDENGDDLPNFLKIGDPVPATLADPLPLGRGWDKGFLWGVTFKVQ